MRTFRGGEVWLGRFTDSNLSYIQTSMSDRSILYSYTECSAVQPNLGRNIHHTALVARCSNLFGDAAIDMCREERLTCSRPCSETVLGKERWYAGSFVHRNFPVARNYDALIVSWWVAMGS